MSICLVKKQKSPLMLFAWWGIADTQTTLSAAFAGNMTKFRMDVLGELRRAND